MTAKRKAAQKKAKHPDPITLSVLERVLLLNILGAASGNIATLLVVREEQDRLGFTDAENQALKFESQEGGGLKWTAAVEPREFEMTVTGRGVVADALKKLDGSDSLRLEHVPLWEKFVGDGE